jgi:3-dehydroquinate synthase
VLTETPTVVRVSLAERSYEIRIGSGLLEAVGPLVGLELTARHAVIVTDPNVRSPHADRVMASLGETGVRTSGLLVAAGEQTKSPEHLVRLWSEMLESGADRKSVVVAVGGGVIGDLAGFLAATFGRGVRFVQVPTTLLAMVDSSVGGKTGINLPAAKNIIGAFWQPSGVLIDTDTLKTLPEREYRSGLAEVVKYGVILDADFFAYLEANVDGLIGRDPDVLKLIIARSCWLKAGVVERDEREETGLRAVLNYGHTFCHAIESVAGYGQYLHGEAVAIGMVCASRLAERLGRIDSELTARQEALLAKLGLPTAVLGLDSDELVAAMRHDKKAEHGELKFVLPTKLGHVEVVGGVLPSDAKAALRS